MSGSVRPAVTQHARTRRRASVCFTAAAVLGSAACDAAPAAIEDAILVASADAHSPTVAVAPDGSTYVAWVSGDSTHDVLLVRVDDGADRTVPPVRVNDIAGDAAPHMQAPAQVAAAPGGNVYVVWQNNTPVEGRRFPASDLRFARSTDGGHTFEPAIYVNDDAGGAPASHTFHDLAVADDGTVYVSWIDSRVRAHAGDHDHDAPGPEIRVARSVDNGLSFEPSVVVTEKACPCCRTSIAVAGSDVHVAWRDVDDANVRNVVVAHSADGGRTWGAPQPVHQDGWSIDGCPHAGPALALSADGRLHAAWYTGAPERPGIYHVTADRTLRFGEPTPLLAGEWVPPSLVSLAAGGSGVLAAWDDRRGEVPRLIYGPAPGGATAAGLIGGASGRAQTAGLAPALAVHGERHALAWLHGDSVFVRIGDGR